MKKYEKEMKHIHARTKHNSTSNNSLLFFFSLELSLLFFSIDIILFYFSKLLIYYFYIPSKY